MRISDTGLELIKLSEGCICKPYLCAAGVPTIGYGSTRHTDGRRVKITDHPITQTKAEAMLRGDVVRTETAVSNFVDVPLKQHQFDALVSLVYNIGIQAFKDSTLLKKLNAMDYAGAAEEFLRWNKAKGKVVAGLANRRERERALFMGE